MRIRWTCVWLLVIAVLVTGCGSRGGGSTIPASTYTPSAKTTLPSFSHVFVIVMENRSYSDIIGNTSQAPYINSLAQRYALATQYYAVSHPSLPNYLALIGGDYYGINSDCTSCFVNHTNLVDTLSAGHKTWRAYMEDMPAPCFVGDSGNYAQKHDPFIYCDDIRTDPSRCNNIVPFARLSGDLSGNQVANYNWITPNLCNDMHNCSTSQGDSWLKQEVPLILGSSAWKQGGVLFITWDEGTDNSGCCQYAAGGRVPLLVIASQGKQNGFTSSTPYDHYSLLRTIAMAWHLTPPGHANDAATFPLTDFFG